VQSKCSIAAGITLLLLGCLAGTSASNAQEQVAIDAGAPTTPFPHFWEQMFGSGRAILTLRESYRERSACGQAGDGFQIRALSRHPARRGWGLQRGRTRQPGLQLFLCRSDLRRVAEGRGASGGGDQLHAKEAGVQSGCASPLLVQAECVAAEESRSGGMR
jgi:hypothetical protein